jgi:hypothetical protein
MIRPGIVGLGQQHVPAGGAPAAGPSDNWTRRWNFVTLVL